MGDYRTLDDADVKGRRVLVRVDLNVPMDSGVVSDTTRIDRIVPTVRELSDAGARVILLAHFGRPKGKPHPDMSLLPVVDPLAAALGQPVAFAADCIGDIAATAVDALSEGEILLLENTRFHSGEQANDPDFAGQLAALGDLFVGDAFSAAHRAHASTVGIAATRPAYAGRAMQAELTALEAGLGSPARPLLAIVGGAKVSTKIDLLENLVKRVDGLAIGGSMANTFLAANGIDVGASLCEHDLAETARTISASAVDAGCEIILPLDVVVAREFAANAEHATVAINAVPTDGMIVDAGPQSVAAICAWMDRAATLVWNGPLGAFELPPFDQGTLAAARHAAALTRSGNLVSVAGGGDTVAALNFAGVGGDFTYVSTAGGAFLEWMEGKTLPGVAVLSRELSDAAP